MKGYKAFDENLQCYGGFQYEIGETYELEGELKFCENAFHFCKTIPDCFDFYPENIRTRICEIESMGKELCEGNKCCTDKIKIVREISLVEIFRVMNQGDGNIGFHNRGSNNQGSNNSGSNNQGRFNFGFYNNGSDNQGSFNRGSNNRGSSNQGSNNQGSNNHGSYNQGNGNCGFFNKGNNIFGCLCTETTPMYLFNKPSDMTYEIWVEQGYDLIIKDLIDNVEVSEEDIAKIKSLPNFDADIFEEITGERI